MCQDLEEEKNMETEKCSCGFEGEISRHTRQGPVDCGEDLQHFLEHRWKQLKDFNQNPMAALVAGWRLGWQRR